MHIPHPLNAAQQSHLILSTISQVGYRTSIRTAVAPSVERLLSLMLAAERGVPIFLSLDVESQTAVSWDMLSCQ